MGQGVTSRSVLFRCIGTAAVLLAASSTVSALTVGTVVWGFDGTVVPGRMNLLSVELVNDSSRAFDGTVTLEKSDGLQRLGARLEQDCFLAPGGIRWVQFHTHNRQENEDWLLRWRGGSQTLSSPRVGPPATVVLNDPDDPLAPRTVLKGFREDLFPVTAAATDGLHAVVLDHAPRWEPVRRHAFLDWLRRGGTVHLLLNHRTGYHPEFGADLDVLNTPGSRFRVGAGLVVRHVVARQKLTEKTLTQAAPAAELVEGDNIWQGGAEQAFFGRLSAFNRPRHLWGLIYLIVGCYILLIGPLNYVLGKRWRHWRPTLILFLALVTGTSFLLEWLGRRGHHEAAAVHTVGIARPVGPDEYDVTLWVNAFVTRGRTYTVRHETAHGLYSTCQETESVNGVIGGGTFVVDMPLYSSRAFVCRGVMKGPDLGLRVVNWPLEGSSKADGLTLAHGPGFPTGVLGMWVRAGDRVYPMRENREGLLVTTTAYGTDLDEFTSEDNPYRRVRGPFYEETDGPVDPRESYREMSKMLIGSGTGRGLQTFHHVRTPLPDDCVQFFVMAPCPEGFMICGNPFGRETGYVMYQVCLFKPAQ